MQFGSGRVTGLVWMVSMSDSREGFLMLLAGGSVGGVDVNGWGNGLKTFDEARLSLGIEFPASFGRCWLGLAVVVESG